MPQHHGRVFALICVRYSGCVIAPRSCTKKKSNIESINDTNHLINQTRKINKNKNKLFFLELCVIESKC